LAQSKDWPEGKVFDANMARSDMLKRKLPGMGPVELLAPDPLAASPSRLCPDRDILCFQFALAKFQRESTEAQLKY
jgi:hypothetical protein